MYILMKTSVGSAKKVRTFLEKSTDVSVKKYGRFRGKVRTFFLDISLFLYIANYQSLTNERKKTTKNSPKYKRKRMKKAVWL